MNNSVSFAIIIIMKIVLQDVAVYSQHIEFLLFYVSDE